MDEATAGTSPARERFWRPRSTAQKLRESLIELGLLCCGLLSIAITIAIVVIVLYGSYEFFTDETANVTPWQFFTGTEWTPEFEETDPQYGVLPMMVGTLMVTGIAAVIALPLGLLIAVYLSEYASPRVRSFAKPTLELLAGVPTVVYGLFAVTVITPFLAKFIPGLNQPYNLLSGGIVVSIMILPMVSSLSEDALLAVPRSLRDASYALGADEFETSTKVVVPAALSGVIASFLLAVSRAVGETMAVTLACGNSRQLTWDVREGLATMTGFIARVAQGDLPHDRPAFKSLFAVAATLFFITLAMNALAQWVLRRYRQVYQ